MDTAELKDEFLRTLGKTRPLSVANLFWVDEPGSLNWPKGQVSEPDYVLTANLPNGKPWLLLLEHSRTGYPRDLEASLRKLRQQLALMRERADSPPVDGVILADALSEDSRAMLQQQGVGYFDAGGSLFLERGDLSILIDRPPPRLAKARLRSVFAPAREQVVHALLKHGGEWMTNDQLVSESESSMGTVSETLKELRQMDWLDIDLDGRKVLRRLKEPGKLLDAWAAYRKTRRDRATRYYRWSNRPEDQLQHIAATLANADFSWALTGDAGANLLGPYLTSSPEVVISVPVGHRHETASRLELKEAPEGGNVTLIERPGRADFLFRQQRDEHPSLWVASNEILYADLLTGKGRSKDAAEQLRKALIGH
jgi:hypothetical protein